jgi:hypothetical protein
MMMAEKGGIKGKPIKVGTRPKAAKDANEKELARIMKDTFATPNEVEFYGKMLAEKLGRPTTPEEGLLAYLERMVPFTDDPSSRGRMLLGIAETRAMLGIDNTEVLQAYHRNELKGFKEMGFVNVRIVSEKDSCPECAKLDGTLLRTDEALRVQPLPCPKCGTKPFPKGGRLCRCRYAGEFMM